MRTFMALMFTLLFSSLVWAESAATIGFNFEHSDLDTVIKEYAKASGQKFIIDPSVHGKVTIINNAPITLPEAFNQLSAALALNSVGISQENDTMILMPARGLQRNNVDVVKELPPATPERMLTWVITLKHISADEVNRQIRIFSSKDGEMSPYTPTNQLIVSDWTSNLQRIAKVINEIDIVNSNPIAVAAVKRIKDKDQGSKTPIRFGPKTQ